LAGYSNDTWEWDGTTWSLRPAAQRPFARYGHTLVFDPVHNRCLLFGGRRASGVGDAWEWDGTNWTPAVGATRPGDRNGHAMAMDAASPGVLLFGGVGSNGGSFAVDGVQDTWQWDGSVWSQRFPASSPSARSSHAMVLEPVRGRVLLFGGCVYYGMSE